MIHYAIWKDKWTGGRELGSVIKPLTYDAWTHKQVNTPKSELAAS